MKKTHIGDIDGRCGSKHDPPGHRTGARIEQRVSTSNGTQADGAMSEEELPVPLGSTLAGKYLLERCLGQGGMGAVYEARNLGTNRRVAVKVMQPEISRNKTFEGRFLREARAMGTIEHPNVVTVFDVGHDPETNCLYLVMEFMQGEDLQRKITQEPQLSIQETTEILAPVMSALSTAHAQGIIHRDIKPANVFLVRSSDSYVPKVIDFGIAKLQDKSDSGPVTRTGMAMGTPAYMSPEQAQESKDVDAQTDVWSVGIMAFEMLTGRYPFNGNNYTDIIVNVMTTEPLRANAVRNTIPNDIAQVILRANARDRDVRYKTMSQFLDAWLGCASISSTEWGRALVRRHGSHELVRTTVTPSIAPAPLPDASSTPTHISVPPKATPVVSTLVGSASEIRVPVHSNRGRTIGIVVAGLVGVGLVVALLRSNTKTTTQPVNSASASTPMVDVATPPQESRTTSRAVADAAVGVAVVERDATVARVEHDAGTVTPRADTTPDADASTQVANRVENTTPNTSARQTTTPHVRTSNRIPTTARCIPDPENGVYCN